MTVLRGMTWSHPRGYDPLVACARLWRERMGVEIACDGRSLQDFKSFPINELAARYDLIIIDHPHVGMRPARAASWLSRASGATANSQRWRASPSAPPSKAIAKAGIYGPFLWTPRPRCRPGAPIDFRERPEIGRR